MADVNERMREREGERKMWITFRLPLVPAFSWGDVCKITCSYEVDWRWLWNWMRGWETASSVRCLWRRLLSAANPSLPLAPPQRPEIKTDKNISSHFRTSRSLTLISLPWAFLLKTLSPHSPALFSLSALYVFFHLPFPSLSLYPGLSSRFVCLLSTLRGLGGLSRRRNVWRVWPWRPLASRIRTSISGG